MPKDDSIQKVQSLVEADKTSGKSSSGAQRILSLFKGIISEFPVGGTFIYMIDDHIAAIKEARLQEFAQATATALGELSDRIDEERIKSDHYIYVFEECLRGVAQHPQTEKIECYKAILINAAVPSNIPDDEQEYFLNLVNTLSPVHIRLIAALNEARKIPQGGGRESGFRLRSHLGNTSGDILMSAAAELYQLQFTNTEPRSIPFDADMSRVGGRLTPIAMKFIEFCTLS